MWTYGDHKVLKPEAESCVPRACRGLPLTQSDVSVFVTPHSNYINIISACLGHRKSLHQKQIHSTAARKGILMRLIPIFWVTVGRKTYEEKKVLEPSRLYTSCAVRHEPCSPVLCNTQLSCSASAGRRNAMRTQGPKPPSLQLWISAWTAPCPRRWECWLSLAPAVALRRILPWWSFWWTIISGAKAEAFLSVGQILSACAFWNWYSLGKSKQ